MKESYLSTTRKHERITELLSPPEIGKSYLVPCIRGEERDYWRPVLEPLHDDSDIGLPDSHYHFDYRFWSPTLCRREKIWGFTEDTLIQVGDGYIEVQNPFVIVVSLEDIAEFTWKPRRCFRHVQYQTMNDFPFAGTVFQEDLENRFAEQKLECGRCPHRGINLTTIVPVNGLIHCPAHGLAWSAESGQMVRQFKG